MTLKNALKQLARWYGINAGELIQYASEDTLLGGVEGNPMGTSYAVDGHLLYALVRYCQPGRILEIGTDHGGSAKHMAAACQRNGKGHIWTLDINPDTGDGVTDADADWITQIIDDATTWVAAYDGLPFDFIFEDGDHIEPFSYAVYKHLPRILKRGGFILSHDISSWVGARIMAGIRKGGVAMEHVHVVTPDPSPLGFSVYQFNDSTYGGAQ